MILRDANRTAPDHRSTSLQAIAKVQQQISAAPHNDTVGVFLNHIVHGTVLYSPLLPAREDENDHESIKTTNVTTAGGVSISFAFGKDGKVVVTSGQSSAKIVKSDVLLDNGVIHYLDTVLANPLQNTTAAQQVQGKNQATSALSATTSPVTADSDSHSSGATILVRSNTVLSVAVSVLLSFYLM
jgi:hypothetical protein